MEKQSTLEFSRRELTMLKGVAILLVLLGHVQHIIYGGAAGVALFLLASGYGIHESFCENGTKQYWTKRMKKVYLPYLLVAVVNVLANWPCGKKKLLITLFGLDFGLNLDATMWYISFIFFWYAVFFLLSITVGKVKKPLVRYLLEAALLFIVGHYCKSLHTVAFHAYAGSSRYCYIFPIGVCMSMVNRTGIRAYLDKVKKPFWVCVLLLCAAYQLRTYGGEKFTAGTTLTMAFLFIAAGKLVSLPWKIQEGLCWLGKYSYGIYLVEGLIMVRKLQWFAVLELTFLMDVAFISASVVVGYFFWRGVCETVMSLLPEKKQ